jgi:hypothetical protein
VQDIAVAQQVTFHRGSHVVSWEELQVAIKESARKFDRLKPNSFWRSHDWKAIASAQDAGSELYRAVSLVEATSDLFVKKEDGTLESQKDLETLMCLLSSFEVSRQSDRIHALEHLAKDYAKAIKQAPSLHEPGLASDDWAGEREMSFALFYWIVISSQLLDIICRNWAPQSNNIPS